MTAVVCLLAIGSVLIAPDTSGAQTVPAGKLPAPKALPATIPIFPLEDVMLFPGMSVMLHIFEPRYRAMVADVLKGDRLIGMVLLRPGYEADYERSPSIFPIGCAGLVTDVESLPDGEYNIVLQAVSRFRITREEASKPYRIAHITTLPDGVAAGDQAALHAQRQKLETLVAKADGHVALPKVPDGVSDEELINGLSQFADIDPLDRQKLLDVDGVLARAGALIDLLQKLIAAPQ